MPCVCVLSCGRLSLNHSNTKNDERPTTWGTDWVVDIVSQSVSLLLLLRIKLLPVIRHVVVFLLPNKRGDDAARKSHPLVVALQQVPFTKTKMLSVSLSLSLLLARHQIVTPIFDEAPKWFQSLFKKKTNRRRYIIHQKKKKRAKNKVNGNFQIIHTRKKKERRKCWWIEHSQS